MSQSFKSSSGGRPFKLFSEPATAGTYIENKKAKASYCIGNTCPVNVKVGSQSNLILFNKAKRLKRTQTKCANSLTFDKTQLYVNLVTQLDLSNVDVVVDLFNNDGAHHPIVITNDATPYLDYNIDPSGNLFGNTICGINNYIHYMKYTDPSFNL